MNQHVGLDCGGGQAVAGNVVLCVVYVPAEEGDRNFANLAAEKMLFTSSALPKAQRHVADRHNCGDHFRVVLVLGGDGSTATHYGENEIREKVRLFNCVCATILIGSSAKHSFNVVKNPPAELDSMQAVNRAHCRPFLVFKAALQERN